MWLWEVCSQRLINDGPTLLGGRGKIVQIDESCFRHKPKHHRGRPPTSQIWVFGMVDTSKTPVLGVLQIVPDRRRVTLLPIIQAHTAPGSIIHSTSFTALPSNKALVLMLVLEHNCKRTLIKHNEALKHLCVALN